MTELKSCRNEASVSTTTCRNKQLHVQKNLVAALKKAKVISARIGALAK